MAVDAYLIAFADAAQRGESLPMAWFTLHSGDLASGFARPDREFVDETYAELAEGDDQPGTFGLGSRKGKPSAESEAAAEEDVKSINIRLDPAAARTTITLIRARVFWGGRADGVELPVLRLSLESVALWWIADGRPIKSPPSSFWGLGVAMPLD